MTNEASMALSKAAVKQALGTHNVTPSLDFGSDVNFKNLAIDNSHFNAPTKSEGNYGSFKTLDKQGKSTRWDEMYEQAIDESRPSPAEIRQEELAGLDTPQMIFQKRSEHTAVCGPGCRRNPTLNLF